jgi:peptidase S41-like protein/tricorn protease-like protein
MRIRLSVFTTVLVAACGGATEPASPGTTSGAMFEAFWSNYDRTYPYFTFKKIDWNAIHDRYARAASDASTDSAFVEVLRLATADLRDVHIRFHKASGPMIPSYTPTSVANWDKNLWASYMTRLGWQQQVSNWGYARVGDVGYVAIGAWNRAQVVTSDFDAVLDKLRDTKAIVFDVRMNGGGDDALAFEVAGRFTTSTVVFGTVAFRNGASHDAFDAPIVRSISTRGSWQYTKPVYLLVGRGCFSSNESFIAAMGMIPTVTVVGDTTGGGTGNPTDVEIQRNGVGVGWFYSLPRWIERLSDGSVIEWNGIPPRVVVPFDASLVASGVDPVLDWALTRAGQQR